MSDSQNNGENENYDHYKVFLMNDEMRDLLATWTIDDILIRDWFWIPSGEHNDWYGEYDVQTNEELNQMDAKIRVSTHSCNMQADGTLQNMFECFIDKAKLEDPLIPGIYRYERTDWDNQTNVDYDSYVEILFTDPRIIEFVANQSAS